MLKAEINEKTTNLEVEGTALDLANDSLNLLRHLYLSVREDHDKLAQLYRAAILSRITDDDFWEPDSANGEPDD